MAYMNFQNANNFAKWTKNDLRCKSRPDLTFLGSFWQKIPGGKAEQLRPEATDALQLELAQEASVRRSNWFFGAKYK